jgi:hypothetical protein
MRPFLAAFVIAASLVGIRADAQMVTNPVQDYINKTTLLNNILSNARATDMSQRAQTKGAVARGGSATANTPTASPTAFKHAGRALLPAALAARATNGADPREAERFFETQLDLYNRTATNDRFPATDIAYAMEYFVVNSYMIYHDLHDIPYEKDPRVKRGKDSFDRITIINEKKALKPTPLQERAVYNQMQATLAANPAIGRMTDREKQELTELMAIMFGANYTAYMRGVNAEDERAIAQARQTAKDHLEKLLGAPIAQIKIDESGVRK